MRRHDARPTAIAAMDARRLAVSGGARFRITRTGRLLAKQRP